MARGILLPLCICEAVLTFAFTVSSAAQSDKDMQMTGKIAINAALSIVGTVNRHRRQNLHPGISALCARKAPFKQQAHLRAAARMTRSKGVGRPEASTVIVK